MGDILSLNWDTAPTAFRSIEEANKAFLGEKQCFVYPRVGEGNPANRALERKITNLYKIDDGHKVDCVLGSSGMSMVSGAMLVALARARFRGIKRPHAILGNPSYGCTVEFAQWLAAQGLLELDYADVFDYLEIQKRIKHETAFVFLESLPNPTLTARSKAEIEASLSAAILPKRGCRPVNINDNTMATPKYINPLALGFDIVVDAGTKFFARTADITFGSAVARKELADEIRQLRGWLGPILDHRRALEMVERLDGFDKSMEDFTATAADVSSFLRNHPAVKSVTYPGFSAIINFQLWGGLESAVRFVDGVVANSPKIWEDRDYIPYENASKNPYLILCCVSFGSRDKCFVTMPGLTTHAGAFAAGAELGFEKDLIRVSVPCFHVELIIETFNKVLNNL